MAMLEIRNVQKTFRTYAKPGLFHRPGARKVTSELPVLRGVDLTVEKGDVVAILGPSGSGKTTLLRCLNFLETADAGQLVFDGESFDLAHASVRRGDVRQPRCLLLLKLMQLCSSHFMIMGILQKHKAR